MCSGAQCGDSLGSRESQADTEGDEDRTGYAIDPETGKMLIDCIQSVAGIRAVDELEARLVALEEKQ